MARCVDLLLFCIDLLFVAVHSSQNLAPCKQAVAQVQLSGDVPNNNCQL